jgi:hypothetical protein
MNLNGTGAKAIPELFSTMTTTVPAEKDGVIALSAVELTASTDCADLPPNETRSGPGSSPKLVPVIVTAVPPAVEPDVGAMDVIVGASALGVIPTLLVNQKYGPVVALTGFTTAARKM